MSRCSDLRVLFRAAAGPRRGFGHLVRCRSLARALGVRPLVAVRGGQRVIDTALALGCDVVDGTSPQMVARLQPDVVVVDDPIASNASRWIAAARKAGCLVVSIHDLGIGSAEGDLVVDGSVTRTAKAVWGRTLAGPKFAVLDPVFAESSVAAPAALKGCSTTKALKGCATPAALKGCSTTKALKGCSTPRVLISLGGGPRAELASAIAGAIAEIEPAADIRVVGGFMSGLVTTRNSRITWVETPRGLGEELSRADVAVLGGGVSLYEACARGVAAVGVPVVKAQEPTVRAFARARAALAVPTVGTSPQVIAERAARLLRDAGLRRKVSRRARQVVDGRGASRVATAIAEELARSSELRHQWN